MTPWVKGIVIAVLQVALVASLGAKLLYDRANLPRAWAQAVPYDPDLPIRGRYVSLQLAVDAGRVAKVKADSAWPPQQGVVLRADKGRLVADPVEGKGRHDPGVRYLRVISLQGDRKLVVLDQAIPFFIPEHIPDPSRRATGEELWVEVTIPGKGPPRPIRLGVSKDGGPIVPLELR
jgi:hypothetical protein